MIPEEAINIIWEKHMDCEDYLSQFDSYPDGYDFELDQAILIAAQALEEIQKYRAIGTVEECREAREKQTPKRPVWKKGRSVICKDYADGHGEVEENKWADWVCPNCGWFVGEQYIPRRHNQQKSNYCSRCGRAIQWDKNLEGMKDEL